MDIIDILLARAMTPQGQTENYVNVANAAAAKAAKAEQDAAVAIASVSAAASDIEEKQSAAEELLSTAQEVLETAQQAQIALPESYSTTGQNTDGYMTQKAVTDVLDTKATITYVNSSLSNKVDNSTLNNYATTTYVNQQIAAIPSGSSSGGVSNLGSNNAGKIVVVGNDGNIAAGEITEEAIIEALSNNGSYQAQGTLGLSIDYQNKSFERIQDAANLQMGSDFNSYAMYGGRMRCNVADDGTINAFYEDNGYTEDGSNGQVMVYQPKFYYQRTIINKENTTNGTIIRKEHILLSPIARIGFKVHPLFVKDNEELDYVLLPAYEGNVYDVSNSSYILNNDGEINISEDKLSSIAGTKPLSGAGKNLTIDNLKTLATNRGTGWQMTNLEFESASQMLQIVEYGNMNSQASLGKGIVNISGSISNGGAITGSTASLGNSSGSASSTIFDNNGSRTTYTNADTVAISYRGMENPWGNLWRIISNVSIKGTGNNPGTIYLNDDISLEYNIPFASSNWISAMGNGNDTYDWSYFPIQLSNSANSAVPVGDALWSVSTLNGNNKVLIGGYFQANDTAGLFNYSCDTAMATKVNQSNARIMFIPTKNSIYTANITKWQQHYGG